MRDEPVKEKISRREQVRAGLRWTRQKWKPFALVGAWVVSTFFMIVLYDAVRLNPARVSEDRVNELVASALASVTSAPAYSAQAYEAVHPAMVFIQTQIITGTEGKGEGSRGSGVLIDDAGSIMTSLHVVDKSLTIQVIFADGTKSEAFILQRDPDNDLALLRARTPPDLPPATLAGAGGLRVGDEVYAVGTPFGAFPNSMTAGVVSGLERPFKVKNGIELKHMIQFDAAVNPGNSGGPLVNRNGEVVGIVTGLANPTEQDVFIGIGFAVPIPGGGGFGSPIY